MNKNIQRSNRNPALCRANLKKIIPDYKNKQFISFCKCIRLQNFTAELSGIYLLYTNITETYQVDHNSSRRTISIFATLYRSTLLQESLFGEDDEPTYFMNATTIAM